MIDFDTKWNEKIRHWAIGQVEDYTTGCLLDYDYIKNCYRKQPISDDKNN